MYLPSGILLSDFIGVCLQFYNTSVLETNPPQFRTYLSVIRATDKCYESTCLEKTRSPASRDSGLCQARNRVGYAVNKWLLYAHAYAHSRAD